MDHQQARAHRRKISFADMERTFRNAGPLGPPPPTAHGGIPASANALLAQQTSQQHLEAIHRQDLARRKSRRPVDRDIPLEIGEAIVGDGVDRYKRLRDVERRLDATMTRKRLDVIDNFQRRYARKEGILRVWVSNTVEGQPWQVADEGMGNDDIPFELGDNSNARYRVKIEGRLLDDPDEDEDDKPPQAQRLRLSSFFKAVTIDFDDRDLNLQLDGFSAMEWRKPQPVPGQAFDANAAEVSFDTLEFDRRGDEEEMHVTIKLTRDERLERFKLSPELAELLDTDEEDRPGVVQGVWEYCRAMGLQEDDDKRKIVCDEPLKKIFGMEQIFLPFVSEQLTPHLHPLPPIELPYTIRTDKAYITGANGTDEDVDVDDARPSRPTVYDIRVALPNPLVHQQSRVQHSKAHKDELKDIIATDDHLALLVQKLHQTNAKRKFYDNLAKDPTSFIKRWISSQQRDMEVIMAEAQRGGGEDASGAEFRRGGNQSVWNTELARESVGLWLARNQKAH